MFYENYFVFQYMNMHVNTICFENIQERLLYYDRIDIYFKYLSDTEMFRVSLL